MKTVLKIIRNILIVLLVVGLIAATGITIAGYQMYKEAITAVSLEDKIKEISSEENYTTVDLMPQMYKNAVIAVEDHRFKEHRGIDFIATGRAVFNNIKAMSIVEGGSTITQQLGKNLYFTQEQRFTRKIAELFVAFDLEKNYSKDKILELYVNTSYFGDGYYGVKEACNGYFKKEVKDMTDYEATMLAGIPNAPSVYAPTANFTLTRQRQKQVLNALVEYGYLSEAQSDTIYDAE